MSAGLATRQSTTMKALLELLPFALENRPLCGSGDSGVACQHLEELHSIIASQLAETYMF